MDLLPIYKNDKYGILICRMDKSMEGSNFKSNLLHKPPKNGIFCKKSLAAWEEAKGKNKKTKNGLPKNTR
ncbi:MAG: hypothetical protein IPH04_08280 [Saprospirales bacterium]|nr:hypothetical protein [Saprospirales bacterium]